MDRETDIRIQANLQDAEKVLEGQWLIYVQIGFTLALLLLALGIEAELLYRTFSAIAGDDNEYWSPLLMATSGVIMLAAFHLFTEANQDHVVMRLLQKLTPFLLGFYLIGLGLLTASVMGMDAAAVMLDSNAPMQIGELAFELPQHWLTKFFESVSSPTSLLFLALGQGGLAIINLFVAHHLLQIIRKLVRIIKTKYPSAKRVLVEYEIYKKAKHKKSELDAQQLTIITWNGKQLNKSSAILIASHMNTALAPHKKYLKTRELSPKQPLPELSNQLNKKEIEAVVNAVEAMDETVLFQLFNQHFPTNP